ncbi:ABC transporter transmembrane domain-containing protein [Hathewaya limosa]|uniref:ATP-binding cassette subfamily B protein n=1 Tax=Hathewaya limosa TaxID=1536 RepID=A0ABU0JW63_HATLI|nr:ABC transporter ATP-binding protein [Hathewaya limosa]MDQ0480324.1 ATP-binding cassette subfamily B protein [Hathewaya limosa]
MKNLTGIKKLRPYLNKRIGLLIFIFILAIITAILNVLPIQIIGIITDLLCKTKITPLKQYIINITGTSIVNFIFLFLLIYVVQGVLGTLYGYIVSDLNNKIISEVRADAYSWILNNNKFHEQFKIGDTISRLTNDIEAITRTVAGPLNGLLVDLLTLIVSLYIFLLWDVRLALISLLGIPIIYFMSKWIATENHNITVKERERIGDISEYLSDVLLNFSLIKSYKTDIKEKAIFNNINKDIYSYRKNILKKFNIYWPVIYIINGLGTAIVVYIVYLSVLKGNLSAGDVIVAYTYITKIYRPIVLLSRFGNDISMADASITRVFQLENLFINEKENSFIYKPLTKLKALELELKNLTIANKQTLVVKDINLIVKANTLITIYGESGKGKSSIINSLVGFTNIISGQILINNIDCTNKLSLRRSLIRICFQNPHIFKRKLDENIYYNAEEHVNSKIFKKAYNDLGMLKLCNEKGQNSNLGGINNSLSGGEKKRLAICRTLNKYSPIYVFDEPTSELDDENRHKVKFILEDLKKEATVIVVTHDKSLMDISNEIYYIEQNQLKKYLV